MPSGNTRFSLPYIRNYYKMPWLEKGLRVEFQGETGTVKGFVNSYVQVLFDCEEKNIMPCHPTYGMKYFDAEGNLLADYTTKPRIIFVGIHNKPHLTPLHRSTRTGKIIEEVIMQLPATYEALLTNIYNVEYLPREAEEIEQLVLEWKETYQPSGADVIVALGAHVQKIFKIYFERLNVVKANHPAQRGGSKAKREDYIAQLVQVIKAKLI